MVYCFVITLGRWILDSSALFITFLLTEYPEQDKINKDFIATTIKSKDKEKEE